MIPVTVAETPDAAAVLAEVGLTEDTEFVGPYTDDWERAVLTVPQRIMGAWARNDADLFADTFTDNGSLLLNDNQMTSREQIRAYMAAGYAGPLKGAKVHGWPLQVTRLSERAAMVVTQGGIMFPGEERIADRNSIRAMWLIVAEEGRWKLLSHQSSPIKG